MRLIDADTLTEKYGDWYVEEGTEEGFIGTVKQLIDAQPYTTTHDSIPAETGKNDGDRTSGDCISRQAALETIRTMQTYKLFEGDDMILVDKAQVQTELMMLPPAQPDVIRCKDCVNYIDHRCVVAGHHVAPFSCCQSVFGAKKKGEQK